MPIKICELILLIGSFVGRDLLGPFPEGQHLEKSLFPTLTLCHVDENVEH